MSESPKKSLPPTKAKKSRRKAIEPPLTLRSRQIVISKGRQELYNTWLSNQSRHIQVTALPADALVASPAKQNEVPVDLVEKVQTAFRELQEETECCDAAPSEVEECGFIRSGVMVEWSLTVPQGFGPSKSC